MSNAPLTNRLVDCFQAVFPGVSPQLLLTLSAETSADWDSVTQVTLLSVIDEEFGIQIPEEQYGGLMSFTALRDFLESYSHEGS